MTRDSEAQIRTSIVDLTLEYYEGTDEPGKGIFRRFPVEPLLEDDVEISVTYDDDTIGIAEAFKAGPLQLELAATPSGLEKLGTFMIALARLHTDDPNPHEHFQGLPSENGVPVQLIIRRSTPSPGNRA